MVSSIATIRQSAKEAPDGNSKQNDTNDKKIIITSSGSTRIYIQVYIFRGMPDYYHKRHTLLYFTSPDNSEFYETIHVQRFDEKSNWEIDQLHSRKVDWVLSGTYRSHVNAGAVIVPNGQEMRPVDAIAAVPLNREGDPEWNCQHFVFEGLQALVAEGLQTQEWYDVVAEEIAEKLVDGALG